MTKKHKFSDFPSNVPHKLIKAYFSVDCNGRELARKLQVNDFYVSQMMKGIEPKNSEIRVKLFLPRKPRKIRIPKPEDFPGQKQIKRKIALMAKATRQELGMQKA